MACRYEHVAKLAASSDPVQQAVAAIWNDVTDRRGWRQEADQFDDEICIDIMTTWEEHIGKFFR
jgi:hypothetical protein